MSSKDVEYMKLKLQELFSRNLHSDGLELLECGITSDHEPGVSNVTLKLRNREEVELQWLDEDKPKLDGVYLPNGKLNISYLIKNADVLIQSKEYPLAINIYQTLIQAGEAKDKALFGLGRCYHAQKELDKAKEHFEESVTYQPSKEAYAMLYSIAVEQQDWLEAKSVLERNLKTKNTANVERTLHLRAFYVNRRLSDVKKAESHLLRALDLDRSSETLRITLADFLREQTRYDDSKRYYQEALSINSQSAPALTGLGLCYFNTQQRKEAHDCLVRSLKLKLEQSDALYHLIKCAFDLRIFGPAIQILENTIDSMPIEINWIYCLGGMQYQMGRLEDAQKTLKKVLELQSDHTGAQELLRKVENLAAGL